MALHTVEKQIKPKGSTTTIKYLKGVTVYDTRSWIRGKFLKTWFANNIDGVRYYSWLVSKIAHPILGKLIYKITIWYGRHIHTNSIILPIEDIIELIQNASAITIDVCDCRVIKQNDSCKVPLYCCMRINNSAALRIEQQGSKGLTKEEAIEIAKNANRNGLFMSLESCIQPFQNNICMCCPDCCAGFQARYHAKLPVYASGPYLPEYHSEFCLECGTCVKACPVPGPAIAINDKKMELNWKNCMGCGLCHNACPQQALTMTKHEERVRNDQELPFSQWLKIILYCYLVMWPLMVYFKMSKGSKAYLAHTPPRESDLEFIKKRYKESNAAELFERK